MIDIIDEIGTIEITFTPKEAENASKSIKQQCRILGLKSKKYLIPGKEPMNVMVCRRWLMHVSEK